MNGGGNDGGSGNGGGNGNANGLHGQHAGNDPAGDGPESRAGEAQRPANPTPPPTPTPPPSRQFDKNRLATSADHQLLYGPRVPRRPARDLGSPLGNPEIRLMNESDLAKLDATRSEQGCAVLSATPLVEVTLDGSRLESRPFHGLAVNAELRRRGTLVIGATGSGKTYRYAINAIHALLRDTDESILYNNLKGAKGTEEIRELVERVAPGVPVIVVAPGDARRSVGINCLRFARRHGFEATVVAHFLATIEKGREGSNYWEMIAKPVLEALMRHHEIDSLAAMHELLSTPTLFESLAQRTEDPDLVEFLSYSKSGSNGATSSVDLAGRVAPLCATDAARAVASGVDEFDPVDCIGSSNRFVLVIECSESTYRTEKHLVSLFLTLWFQSLLKVSEDHGGVLPRGVNMIIDEFGVTPPIPDLADTLNLGRGRGYAFVGLAQSLGQVRATYREDAESLFAGFCSSVWFCSGLAVLDREVASRIAGNIVVKDWSTTMRENSHDGSWEADSRTSRSVTRPLLLPEDFMISDHPNFGGYAVVGLVDSKPAYCHFTGAWECPDIDAALKAAAKRPPTARETPLPAVPRRGLVKLSRIPTVRKVEATRDLGLSSNTLSLAGIRMRVEFLRKRINWPLPPSRTEGPRDDASRDPLARLATAHASRLDPALESGLESGLESCLESWLESWLDRWVRAHQENPLRILEVFEAMDARGMKALDLLRAVRATKARTAETAIAWWDFDQARLRERKDAERRGEAEPTTAADPARPEPEGEGRHGEAGGKKGRKPRDETASPTQPATTAPDPLRHAIQLRLDDPNALPG